MTLTAAQLLLKQRITDRLNAARLTISHYDPVIVDGFVPQQVTPLVQDSRVPQTHEFIANTTKGDTPRYCSTFLEEGSFISIENGFYNIAVFKPDSSNEQTITEFTSGSSSTVNLFRADEQDIWYYHYTPLAGSIQIGIPPFDIPVYANAYTNSTRGKLLFTYMANEPLKIRLPSGAVFDAEKALGAGDLITLSTLQAAFARYDQNVPLPDMSQYPTFADINGSYATRAEVLAMIQQVINGRSS